MSKTIVNAEYVVVYGDSPSELSNKVNKYIKQEYRPEGSHQVVVMRQECRYRGDQLIDTLNKIEYSQTLIKWP